MEHRDKRMKGKEIPITMISKEYKHDNLYYHKQAQLQHQSLNEMMIDNNNNNKNNDDNVHRVVVAIGQSSDNTTTINISQQEYQLFQILLDVVKVSGCNTTLRVAGGWVRDKLRGDNSSDIDIALDNMMGEGFASLVNKYLADHKQETHRIGVIQSNPEQSKHLETATVKIYDTWVDFVNLRSETYSTNSRIPEIKIGTPEQDAFRRDLTINSLFYNVNENRIEDFTGCGISDLKHGIIRTPLPPGTTFLDDPLRVLRSIRFATRLYYAMDHKLVEAASSPTVKEALKSKVSHERIGIELDGMLNGPRPDLAIHLIYEFGLFDHIFNIPQSVEIKEKDYDLKSTENILNMMRFINWGVEGEETPTRKLRLLSSLFSILYPYTFKNKKNKDIPVLQFTMVEHLKISNKECDDVINILECSKSFKELVDEHHSKQTFSRKRVGLIVYKAGALWRAALANALISELPKFEKSIVYPVQHTDVDNVDNKMQHDFDLHTVQPHAHHPPMCEESKKIVLKYDSFCASVASHDLVGVWHIKKLLNGKQVMELLNRKPGEWLTPVLQHIFEYQLENPQSTEQQCKDYVLLKYKS